MLMREKDSVRKKKTTTKNTHTEKNNSYFLSKDRDSEGVLA